MSVVHDLLLGFQLSLPLLWRHLPNLPVVGAERAQRPTRHATVKSRYVKFLHRAAMFLGFLEKVKTNDDEFSHKLIVETLTRPKTT